MMTLADLRLCREAAQMALLWLDDGGTAERIAQMQSLIARLDVEMGEAADGECHP